jgi:ribosomal protein L11 methyltransferase
VSDEWREVEVEVEPAAVDRLSGALWAAGAAGVEERRVGSQLRLIVAVRAEVLDGVLVALGDRPAGVRSVAADAGLDAWREYAMVTRVGDVVIQPVWRPDAATKPTDVIVRLDPGRVFGSGAHVTTRLALELLAAESITGLRVLDVGTGSGVLAVAAAALSAAHVLAVDIDEEAREVATRNLARNHAGSVVAVSDVVVGCFDVVVANITVPTLVELSADLCGALRPGGRLVLSGMLRDQEPSLRAAFDGVQWIDRRSEGDWIALAGRQTG